MIPKNKELFIQRLLIGLIIIFAFLTVARVFFTVDITDESFPIAETLSVLKGNVPYAYCSTDVVGMTFYMVPFVLLYKLLVPSLAGIVLYMRLCFSILRLFLVFVVYRLLRKKHEDIPVLLSCLVLTVWYYHSNYFSYNSNSMWTLIVVSCWLYILYDAELSRINFVKLFCVGVLSAMSVFSHPFSAIAVGIYVVLLLIFSPQDSKIKRTLLYCAGGIFQACFVLFCIVIQVGFSGFLNGIRNLMNMVKYSESYSKTEGIILYCVYYKNLFLAIIIAFIVTLIATKILNRKIDTSHSLSLAMATASLSAFFFSVRTGFDLILVGAFIGSSIILLNIILYCVRKEYQLLFISLPFIVFVLIELVLQRNYAVSMHPSLAVPAVIPIILLLGNEDVCCKLLSGVSIVIFAIALIASDMIFVYRDEPMKEMTTVVSEGVYKGIRTTFEKAKCLPEIEKYIDSITENGKKIMFRDNVPFAYLMYKGETCELQTWDILNYTQGWKLERIMYNYFLITDTYPDEIVYIDFGRDDCLSIEGDTFRFNKWVNSYYDFTDEKIINSMFRVKVYDSNGSFDGDLSEWTNFKKW